MATNDTPSEHIEQREFVSWFRKRHRGVRIIAIPNGGQRSIATAARLKAEGVMPGVPDLFIPAWRVWIEMKREKGGSVSADQKEWIAYLEECGYRCFVARGAEDAKRQIIEIEDERRNQPLAAGLADHYLRRLLPPGADSS